MTKQVINTNAPEDLIGVGATANDKKGDSLRAAFTKVNDAADKIDANFTELYSAVGLTDNVFKPPMLTQAQIDSIVPQVGMLIYNTTTGKFQGYAADANNDSTAGWADLH